jgi:hypothetical protein
MQKMTSCVPLHIRLFLIIIIAQGTVSCNSNPSNDWQTLDFVAFKLKTPMGWSIIKEEGADSYVGGLTNGKDTLSFDYGLYSAEIDNREYEKHLYAQDTINGLIAMLQIPKVDGSGYIIMSIPHVGKEDKFSISGTNIKGTDTILQIFKSIIFKNIDPTKNSKLTRSKFKEFPFGSGRTLYYYYCQACHAVNKIVDGPRIEELVENRSTDWIHKFLTNRKAVASDSLYQARVELYRVHCFEFTNLSKQDVEQIVGYLKGK